MNVEIRTEAAQFPGKELVNGIFVAVPPSCECSVKIQRHRVQLLAIGNPNLQRRRDCSPAPYRNINNEMKITFVKHMLKVPKREIFDRSDFPDFYTIKSSWVGDLVVKI
jgi:hypothetical protein